MHTQHYPSTTRGHANHGWLDTFHSFSFASFYDPSRMGFGPLRVLNDDRVAAGRGFGAHPHRDMEILTFVLEGALEHRDSAGHRSVIRPGDVQYMSAGRGVHHSEYNASQTDPVRFLQVWIVPQVRGAEPRYAQKHFAHTDTPGTPVLVASNEGRDGSIAIRQDADIYRLTLQEGQETTFHTQPDRRIWVHAVQGSGVAASTPLKTGDGLAFQETHSIVFRADAPLEVLVFDMGSDK